MKRQPAHDKDPFDDSSAPSQTTADPGIMSREDGMTSQYRLPESYYNPDFTGHRGDNSDGGSSGYVPSDESSGPDTSNDMPSNGEVQTADEETGDTSATTYNNSGHDDPSEYKQIANPNTANPAPKRIQGELKNLAPHNNYGRSEQKIPFPQYGHLRPRNLTEM